VADRLLVDDALWEVIEPLLPDCPPQRTGRPRVADRAAFTAIVFVCARGSRGGWFRPRSVARASPRGGGCASGRPPACGSGCTASCCGAWTRSAGWTGRAPSWTPATSALFKGALTGPSPVDRGRTGSKHHLIVDANGLPLAATFTGGNRNDVTQLLPLVDGIGPAAGKRGRPRQRPDRAVADRGYDHDKYRRELWRRNVKPVIARRGTDHGSGLGRWRWVVERTFAWLHNYRRLRIRCDRDPLIHTAFLTLAMALICWNHLSEFWNGL
jgi:transposase